VVFVARANAADADSAQMWQALTNFDLSPPMSWQTNPPTQAELSKFDDQRAAEVASLVDFWGTWCPVCVQEMPELKKIYAQYHEKDFEIIGLNYDENTNVMQQFLKQNDLPWPQEFVGRQSTKYLKDYSINFFPTIWLVDKKGIVRDIHGRVNMEAKLQKLLAE